MNNKLIILSLAIVIVLFAGVLSFTSHTANAIIDGECVGCDDLPYKGNGGSSPGGNETGGGHDVGGIVPGYGNSGIVVSCSINTSKATVTAGEEITISWVSYSATSALLLAPDGTPVTVGTSGSQTFTANQSGTYTLVAINDTYGKDADCSTSVTVANPPPAPVCTLSGDPTTIEKGDSSTLTWTTTNATSVSIDNGVGSVSLNSSTSVSPTADTTYVLTATGPGGTVFCAEQINVTTPPPAPTCDFFTADPTHIDVGELSKLEWGTTNATSVSINQGIGSVAVDGDIIVKPTSDTTYTLTAVGAGGTATCNATVTVSDEPPKRPSCPFSPKPGRTIVNFDKRLFSDRGVNQSFESESVSLPAGTYTVQLAAWDGYIGRESITPQPHEQYHVLFKNGSTLVAQSNATSDLPDSIRAAGVTELVNSALVVGTGINTIVAEHAAYPDTSSPNSLEPTCAAFDPVPVEACTLTASPTSITSGGTSTLTWTSTSGIVSGSIDQGVGAVTPVHGGSTSVAPTSDTTYTFTGLDAANKAVQCSATVAVTPVTPQDPVCTLSASPTSIEHGDSSTLVWTTTNAVSFVIDQGVGNVTPVPSGSRAVTPATTTTYTGTATSATGKTATCTAEVGVFIIDNFPQCTLSVSASQITTGESVIVSWTSANVTDGFIDNNVGTTTPVSSGSFEVFPGASTHYTGTFTGPHGTVSCDAQVKVITGGCTGACGGGLDQPSVSLFNKPGEQPLAFVSLSQIPYTGFEAGPLLTILFWMAIGLWSLGITYLFFGKESMKLFARRVLGFDLAFVAGARSENRDYDPSEDISSNSALQSTMTTPSVPATLVTEMPATAPAPATEYVPSLEDVIESRAHAAGVLLSPEAVKMATDLGDSRLETLQKLGKILDEAVKKVPREDGWILLSTDRLLELAKNGNKEVLEAVTPETDSQDVLAKEVLNESAHEQLVNAILSGDRETATTLVRTYETEGTDASTLMTGVASVLDTLYRARKSGVDSAENLMLQEKSAHVSDEKLMKLIELFANALDTVYVSKYTGVKLAIAQAFEV